MQIEHKEFKELPENIKKKINTTINLIKLFEYYNDDYFDDWSFIIHPIVIALEGYIKWLLIKSNIKVNNHFRYFDKECKPYKLKENIVYNKSKKDLIIKAEYCYNIYVLYRNKVCHYEITNKYNDSFFIQKKSDVIDIFDDIYLCFKETELWKDI